MNKTDKIYKEIAESEYNTYEVGKEASTNHDYLIGITLDFNDNRPNIQLRF